MKICMNGNIGHLRGDLTDSGVTHRCINAMTVFLHQIACRGEKSLRIDCGKISRADLGGLRLLYVWMQCARFSGVELELVNLSDGLQQMMQRFGLGHGFIDQTA